MKRVHAPRGKLNVGDKQDTIDLIEGDVKLRFHNSFIYVGVDISMRYSQGDGVNTSLSKLVLCPRSVAVCSIIQYWITHATVMCCLGR